MTDETASLALDILKRVEGDMALLREDMRGMRVEMGGIKQLIAAFMTHEVKQDSDIDAIRRRPDRIERRPDLVD